MDQLKFNDQAPDAKLLNSRGQPIRLSSLWKKQPILLAFSRHFGCPQCKQMLQMLVSISDELRSAGLLPVIITQAAPSSARSFCSKFAGDILCLSDPERVSYRAYGLQRANLWQSFLSLHVWKSNFNLLHKRGWRTELPPRGQDALQLGGIFVIGKDGRVHLPYYYDDIADHPPIDLLLHGVLDVDWKRPLERPLAPVHHSLKRKAKAGL